MKTFTILFFMVFLGCKSEAGPSLPADLSEIDSITTSENHETSVTNSSIAAQGQKLEKAQTKKAKPIRLERDSKPSEKEQADEALKNDPVNEEKANKPDPEKPELPPVYKEPTPLPKGHPVNDVTADLHDDFDGLLKKYVSNSGKVDYRGLKKDKGKLEAYIQKLKDHFPQNAWSQNKQLAYWINAYNAFTLMKVIENYPIASIKDLDKGNPWDVRWITLGGKTYSLNQIENDIIRAKFKDARIHFAVNCAARSCPPLWNRAYTETNLQSALSNRTTDFINNGAFNTLQESRIEVSKIFEWYAADFGDLISFIRQYTNTNISPRATVAYKSYDWALNQ